MTVQWRRPLIYGGVGVTLLALGFDGLNQLLGDWLPAIVLGSGIAWAVMKFQKIEPLQPKAAPVTLTTVKTALTEAESVINQLAFEVTDLSSDGSAQQLSDLRSQINQVTKELQRDDIRLVAIGGKSVGKTTLTGLLERNWASQVSHKLTVNDTPELFAATEGGIIAERDAWQLTRSSDLVLFVTNGDLTATEFQAIERITTAQKRLILLFNKQDQYRPEDQQAILTQLRQRVQKLLPPQDVIAIATNPTQVKVRQLLADGMTREWLEKPNPQISPLIERLNQILMQEGQQLILTSSLSNLKEVKSEAKTALNQVWRDRAMPIVEQAQWIVAGTAFANPFPALDLLATAAINAQMVMDLSKLYQRKFSLDQAKTIAATIAGLMLKLGLVEVSTQAIAGILKTNAVTFIAGGLIQGVSGAYLTRLAGLTLIEYFEGEASSEIKRDRLQQILQTVFEQNRRLPFMQMFVKQALDKLRPTPLPAKAVIITPPDGLPAPAEAPLQIGAKLDEQPLVLEELVIEGKLAISSVKMPEIASQEMVL
ncbi:MAG: DUF697 domain-containing protein [Myxacorys californica WJT36-NPBG1]|nr:DUF697 domain-containing protein [Myxacorys californica WJT36-NPBG1]